MNACLDSAGHLLISDKGKVWRHELASMEPEARRVAIGQSLGLMGLCLVDPESIGALTDSPIIALGDDGQGQLSRLWWHAESPKVDPWLELARTGRVLFMRVPRDLKTKDRRKP